MEFLYIFPDVHIWADKTNLLFFDTRNQKNIKVALNGQNLQLYEDLTDVRNLYCVELRQDNRDEALLNELIHEGFGKVLQTDCMHRPIAIPPYHIMKERFSVGGKRFFPRVLDYTKTLTIHLGGCCKKAVLIVPLYINRSIIVREKQRHLRQIICKRFKTESMR